MTSFLGIVLVFLTGIGWRFYRLLGESSWDGKHQLNLAFQAETVFLASFDPGNQSVKILIFPEGTFIQTIHGHGPYRLESVYPLGKLEGRGGELLAGSLQEYLGFPVDGYFFLEKEKVILDDPKGIKNFLKKTTREMLLREKETNLSRWDLFCLWWLVNRVKGSDILILDLGEHLAFSSVLLPDGTAAVEINQEQLDRDIQSWLSDEAVRTENLSLAVLNATSHSGLARQGARLITNLGGRVVAVGEKQESRERCELRSSKKYRDFYTVSKLGKIFGCLWTGEELENQRAQVVLILGEDYWQKLNR